MPDGGFDPLRILAGLRAHGVRYVLVGGLAAAAHGSPAGTDDVDICLAGDPENLERVGLALQDLGAGSGSVPSGDTHRASFETVAGRLDCLEMPEGTSAFTELDARASDLDMGLGVVARVASVDDLIQLKRASGDLSGAAHISSLRDEPEVERGIEADDLPEHGPTKQNRRERLWRALEDVDRFLTDLNNKGVRRQKRESDVSERTGR